MRDLYNLFEKPKDPLAFSAIRISLAAPERIREWFYEFDPVDPFIAQFENALPLPDNKFQLQRGTLPPALTLYVPDLPN